MARLYVLNLTYTDELKIKTGKYIMRNSTNLLLEMMDDGLLSAEDIVLMCLKYMSEDDVAEMMVMNEIDSYLWPVMER